MDRLVYPRHQAAVFVHHIDGKGLKMPAAACGRTANPLQLFAVQGKCCLNLFFYGFDKRDMPGFIPDIVGFAEVFDQHQHVKGIGHGKQAAAEMGAHIVGIEGCQPECRDNFAPIPGDVLHMYAGSQKGGPQIHQQAK